MIDQRIGNKSRLYARKYSDMLLSGRQDNPSGACWYIPRVGEGPEWGNPENIESGASGIILFLLEYYKHSGDGASLEKIDGKINELRAYCAANPTDNYSLYTGRGGFIYLLMQRYLLDKGEGRVNGGELLRECVELIKPANQMYLHSKYTSDYLFDGRSGTLLLLLNLFKWTNDGLLLEYIDQFLRKIMANARLLEAGICWTREGETGLRASCGFAHGVAGIKYVFRQLQRCCPTGVIEYLLKGMDQYLASCWVEDFQNWGDFGKEINNKDVYLAYKQAYVEGRAECLMPGDRYSWADGTTGILIACEEASDTARWKTGMDELNRKIVSDHHENAFDLYAGITGAGMLYWTSGEISRQQHIREKVLDSLDGWATDEPVNMAGGLFHGRPGTLYYLLRTSGKQDEGGENILMPFHTEGECTVEKITQMGLAELKGILLSKHYPRTLNLLESTVPDVLRYLENANGNSPASEVAKFGDFVVRTIRKEIDPSVYERLLDLFTLESTKRAFAGTEKRTPLALYFDGIIYQDHIIECLNRPDDWLLMQPVSISRRIKIAGSKWDWSFLEDFKKMDKEKVQIKQMQNLQARSSDFYYLLQIFGSHEVTEFPLTMINRMILERFHQPKKIWEALEEIRLSLKFLPLQAQEALLQIRDKQKGPAGSDPEELQRVILKTLRPLIYRNVLELL